MSTLDTFLLDDLDINDGVNFFCMPPGPSYGVLEKSWSERRAISGVAKQGPIYKGALVQMKYPIKVVPSDGSAETLRSLLAQLRAKLNMSSLVVTAIPEGMTTPVYFECYECDEAEVPNDTLFRFQKTAIFELTLWRKPYALRQAETLYNASVFSPPGVVDLSSMTTEHKTPLTQTFAGELHDLYISYVPEEHAGWADSLDWIKWAVDYTWFAGAAEHSANAFPYSAGDDNAVSTIGTGAVYTDDIDLTNFPTSPYLVLPRVKTSITAGGCYAGMGTYPYTTANLISQKTLTSANTLQFSHEELGTIHLPYQKIMNAETLRARVYFTPIDGSKVTVNYVAFLPTRWGWWRYHNSDPAFYAELIYRSGDNIYIDDRVLMADVRGGAIEAKKGRLLVLAEFGTGIVIVPYSITQGQSYTPRMTLY